MIKEYNGVFGQSVIKNDINDLINVTATVLSDALKEDPEAMALFVIPVEQKNEFEKAYEEKVKDGTINEKRSKIQYIDYGEDKKCEDQDFVSQFIFGIEALEYARGMERRSRGEKYTPEEWFKNMLMVMAANMVVGDKTIDDPEEMLKMLFDRNSVLTIRKINWNNMTEKFRAWEALATSV
ncbi:MAG: hypothetical protein HQL29_00095 [Candidatus Omnitrophica bacterium]|nr:hypothetical protein [Candidatus Omnitrophota bacterium]